MTDQYVTRAKNVVVVQDTSIKSALERTLNHQGWTVSQKSFIPGARSLNEKDLHDNLTYFKVPEADIESIRSKLDLIIFDEYTNILKGMYSTRFDGRPKNKGDHDQMDTSQGGPSPPLESTNTITIYYIHLGPYKLLMSIHHTKKITCHISHDPGTI